MSRQRIPPNGPGASLSAMAWEALDALPAHICILDGRGDILAVNRAWRRFGRDNPPALVDDGIGQNYLVACEEAQGPGAAQAAVFAGGLKAVLAGESERFSLEYPCHDPDGEEQWFLARVTRLEGAGPARVVVTHDNITERRRADAMLRTQHRLSMGLSQVRDLATTLDLAVQAALDVSGMDCGGVYLFDGEGVLKLERFVGLSAEFAAAVRVFAPDSPSVRLLLEGQSIYGSVAELPVENRDLDLREGLRALAIVPLRDAGRVIGCIIGASRKTDRVAAPVRQALETVACAIALLVSHARAHIALREREAYYRSLFMSAPDAVLVAEGERVAVVNGACLALFGAQGPQQLQGRTLFELFHGDAPAAVRAGRGAAGGTGPPVGPVEDRVVRLDGTVVDVEVRAAPVVLAGSDAVHVILTDISERKAQDLRIVEAATVEQERIGRDIHDGMGQQLTALGMLASSIEARLAAAGREEARAMGELRGHLQQTLDDARNLARGLSPVEIEPKALAEALSALADQITDSTGVDCAYRGSRQLAVGDHHAPAHLYRIAQEAAQNAVRHAWPRRVEIALTRDAEGIVLTVDDDGCGLDPTHQAGPGLGLHTMRYRARIIGGHLSIGPGPSGGTRVKCVVPGVEVSGR